MVLTQKKLMALAIASFVSVGATNAFASGDAANGANLFKTSICSACHSTVKGGASPIGPNLFGVVGRKAGSLAGFSYSPAMKAAGMTWDEANLAKYLMSPSDVIPGNKMIFNGLKKQEDAESVAAYLATLK